MICDYGCAVLLAPSGWPGPDHVLVCTTYSTGYKYLVF